MVTVNILSDCVSRDSCTLLVKSGDVKVMQHVNYGSIYSMTSKKPDKLADISVLEDCRRLSHFGKRSFIQDYNKEMLDYIFAKKSDYLILSWTPSRLTLLKKRDHFFALANDVDEAINDPKVNAVLGLKSYERISPFDIPENEWKERLEKICDIILSHYTVDQIILHKHYPVLEYESDDACLKRFPDPQTKNKMINLFQMLDNLTYEKLKGCHIIEFCDNVIGFQKHWLGLYHMHYVDKYYQYSAEALKTIFSRLPRQEETARLEKLRQEYNDWFSLRREYLALKTKYVQMELRLTSSDISVMTDCKNTESIEEQLRATKSIRVYLDLLKKVCSQYLIVLAVKDTPGNCLPDDILEQIHELGFRSFGKELWKMYIGVSLFSEITCDKVGEKAEEPVSFDYVNEDLTLSVLSKSWRNGNVASIKINDQEYAVNIRGINIVVYDLNGGIIIDSIALDAHGPVWTFKRK